MFGKETADDHDSALALPLGLYVLIIIYKNKHPSNSETNSSHQNIVKQYQD